MDEEIRRVLKQAVDSPERLGDLAVCLFSPAYGEDELELPSGDACRIAPEVYTSKYKLHRK